MQFKQFQLKRIKKQMLTGALAGVLLFGSALPVSAATGETFSDVDRRAWYYQSVTNLTNAGIVAGYGDGTFRPDHLATTGEALKLILTACGIGTQSATSSHWASGYLSYANSNALLEETATTQLEIHMTRGDVAKLIVNALALELHPSSISPFADTDDPYVTTLYEAGLIAGSYFGSQLVFLPNDPISRAELCALVERIYKMDKIQYGSYLVDIAPNVPRNTYDKAQFQMSNGFMTYGDQDTAIGIDVSYYQKDIDWTKVKNAGIDFVMIRLGYRGYTSGKLVLDERFQEYLAGAKNAGLDVGIYFFSQAITVQEAEEEAQFVLQHLGGTSLEYPLVFDWEIIGNAAARTDDLPVQTLTSAARQFCDTIAAAGYTPAIYFTKYLGYVCYDISQLSDYDFWFAEYGSTPNFYYDFDMWQYTDKGSIPGISGPVDVNICFKQY